MRQAIAPGDILEWAASGQLPYFQLAAIAEEAAAEAAAAEGGAPAAPPLPPVCVTPQIWDTPARLVAHTRALAARLGLPALPPANAEALLRRASLDLGAPAALAAAAQQLLRAHLLGKKELELPAGKPRWGAHLERPMEAAQPHVLVVALLVVAAKLVYGLGSSRRGNGGGGGSGGGAAEEGGTGCGSGRAALVPGMPPAPASWQEWAGRALLRIRTARGRVPVSQAEVRGWDEEARRPVAREGSAGCSCSRNRAASPVARIRAPAPFRWPVPLTRRRRLSPNTHTRLLHWRARPRTHICASAWT
jgi:hypothetical protein